MDGPPFYGLDPLQLRPWTQGDRSRRYWVELPDLARPFPFKKRWFQAGDVSEELAAESDQSLASRSGHGCLLLGEDGCGTDWLLVVTDPSRGNVWNASHVGLTPTVPKRDFLLWIEDWLDGTDPEDMFTLSQ
jgi:hypothetical protein